jgi:hypothetical protein
MSTSQKATILHRPVLKNDLTSEPPWLPMPQQARLTLSLAATGFTAELVPIAFWVSKVGSDTAAVRAAAFFRNKRLDDSFDFMKIVLKIVEIECVNFYF